MKPIVLELDRKNDTGSTSRSPLLPSVAFYYRNNEGKIVADVAITPRADTAQGKAMCANP